LGWCAHGCVCAKRWIEYPRCFFGPTIIVCGTVTKHSQYHSGVHVVRGAVRRTRFCERTMCRLPWSSEEPSSPAWYVYWCRVGFPHVVVHRPGAGVVLVPQTLSRWLRLHTSEHTLAVGIGGCAASAMGGQAEIRSRSRCTPVLRSGYPRAHHGHKMRHAEPK
jgi:hypothetical protein